VVVFLAYVPDIVTQIGFLAGWSKGRLLGHSVVLAVTASLAIAALLVRLAAVSFTRAFLTSLVSLLLHDVLDLAQATDRAPWWPLFDRPMRLDLPAIPTDFLHETAVFGGLFLAFLALRHAVRQWAGQKGPDPAIFCEAYSPRAWLGRIFIVAVVLAAAVTHSLRDRREAQLEAARALVEQRAYSAALEVLARAERWPPTVNPGRIDYVRAEAYAGRGDRRRAETYYLRAYGADPMYLWTVADLAIFYASSSEPVAERRRLIAPYLSRLRTEFARDPALPEILARVEARLVGSPPPDGASNSSPTPGIPVRTRD
jgi:tetratricopeptide (TPR) repeat protein